MWWWWWWRENDRTEEEGITRLTRYFLPNFGHEKCPRLLSPLLWNSARPYYQPAKSENRSGFIAIWESTGTNKQCFDERNRSRDERVFVGTLHALSSNILRLASCRRRKSFLRGSWEKSLAEVSFRKGFISAVWCPYLKNENEENMKKVFILCFDALVAQVWSLRTWIFSTKNTIFRSIRLASRLLMDELTGFAWLARSKKITPPLRGYPILSKAISTSWILKTKC